MDGSISPPARQPRRSSQVVATPTGDGARAGCRVVVHAAGRTGGAIRALVGVAAEVTELHGTAADQVVGTDDTEERTPLLRSVK